MTQLNFNAATVAPRAALDPIPSGWYRAIIEKSSMEPTSKPGGQMLAIELKIIDGEFVNRKLFDRLNLVNENPTTVQIAFEQLSAICHATGVIQCAQSEQLHNIPLLVKCKLRPAGPGSDGKHYDASNEVKGYDNINADRQVGPSGPVTAGGVAGAPVGTPPWQGGPPAAAAQPAFPAPATAPAAVPVPTYAPPAQFQPPTAVQPWQQPAAAPAPAAVPQHSFTPPSTPAPAPAHVMLPAAGGVPYESFIAQGWTDDLLVQHGMMVPPVQAAPLPPAVPAAPVAPLPPGQAPLPPAAAPAAGTMPPPWAQRPAG